MSETGEQAAQSICVIDDEKHIVRLIVVNLERAGYRTCAAYDGVEGLEEIRRETPDLVVLDHLMPRLSGVDMLKQLRQDPELMSVPVVAVTCKGPDTPEAAFFREWAQAYVPKPFNPVGLIGIVRRILGVPDHLRERVAEVRRLRFDPATDPRAFVSFIGDDPQVTHEAQEALRERGEAALPAMVAARMIHDVAALRSTAAYDALVVWLDDPDAAFRFQVLQELAAMERPHGQVCDSPQAYRVLGDFLAAAERWTDDTAEQRLRWAVSSIGDLPGRAAADVLRRVRDEDLRGMGGLAAELLQRRADRGLEA
ncbi:MAG: response regulator [Armatimonadetes bacterium]|nr:response regulator [Armatimonadota bacterium]